MNVFKRSMLFCIYLLNKKMSKIMNAAPDNGCLRNSFGTLCMPHEDGTGPRTLAHGSPMHYAYARRLHLPRVRCVILCSRRPTGFKVVFFSWQFFTSSPTTPLYFFHYYYLRFTHTRPLARMCPVAVRDRRAIIFFLVLR